MIIKSRQNSLVKQFRTPGDLFVIEGAKLVSEALLAGFTPKAALFTEKAQKQYEELFTRLSAYIVSDDISEYISDTKSPQGVFAMFSRREAELDFKLMSRVVMLDCVQDPVNVGAIIRSCEAFGIGGVVLSNDSADMYSPKVMRASAGSVLRQPCKKEGLTDVIPRLKEEGYTVYASALCGDAVNLRENSFFGKVAVVIGNEGKGVSAKVLELCDKKLYIPISGAESLNAGVAAGIICYELND